MKCALLLGATGTHIKGPVVRVPLGKWCVVTEGSCDKVVVVVDNINWDNYEPLVLDKHSDVHVIATNAKELSIRIEKQ